MDTMKTNANIDSWVTYPLVILSEADLVCLVIESFGEDQIQVQ